MLAGLTLAHYLPCIGQVFELRVPGAPATLNLASATALAGSGGVGRQGFSLVFTGSAALDQNVYTTWHPLLGEQALFMVPIAPDEQGLRYEAIFN